MKLAIRVEDQSADLQQMEDLTRALRRELLELDVSAVDVPVIDLPPTGARGVDVPALGTLVVAVARRDVLAAIISAVKGWLAGRQQRSVRMEIDGDVLEMTGVSSRDQQRLIDAWLQRRKAADDG